MSLDIEKLRKEINEVDKKMKELFIERMKIVKNVAIYKKENNKDIFDSKREMDVIERNSIDLVNDDLYNFYKEFLGNVMEISKEYQRHILTLDKIGYQGEEGAFSYLTSKKLFPLSSLVNYKSFEDLIVALENKDISYAVLPFENSFTGEVKEVLDLLYKHDVYINGIYDLDVSQNLIGIKGSKIEDIEEVYSHEQAIEQSKEFFEGKEVIFHKYINTASSAKLIKELNNPKIACIASKESASRLGLEVLKSDINTSKENKTRFVILERERKYIGNRFSLVFTVKNGSGKLAPIMNIIASHGFDLECIRSHSLKNEPWQYFFYVEVVGDLNSENSLKMLEELEKSCLSLKILGSYTVKRD